MVQVLKNGLGMKLLKIKVLQNITKMLQWKKKLKVSG